MKGTDLTARQMDAAAKFIAVARPDGRKTEPQPDQWYAIKWEDLVRLVAIYGWIRAQAVANGGSVDEPWETREI